MGTEGQEEEEGECEDFDGEGRAAVEAKGWAWEEGRVESGTAERRVRRERGGRWGEEGEREAKKRLAWAATSRMRAGAAAEREGE